MNNIDLQIEQIESARQELKKHFGEHYELSALTHTIPLLEELKAIKESAVFYSNRPIEDIVLEARADAIDECKVLVRNNRNLFITNAISEHFLLGLEQLKEQK